MGKKADLILENARVITCEPKQPKADAVAVHGERILGVGTNKEVHELAGESTRVVDCRHKTLVPGFNDAHLHFFSFVRKLFSLDLSPANVHSIKDIQGAIRSKARFTPAGRWISGTGYNEFYLAEKRPPNRWELDAATQEHPVIIVHRSLHAAVLNSLALSIVGITNETEEPAGGRIERDLETGEPNGVLSEMQEYVQSRIKSPIAQEEMDWGIGEANRQLLSAGITSFGEATVTNDLTQWKMFLELKESVRIEPRINMLAGSAFVDEFLAAGLKTGAGDNSLRLGHVKIVLGGTRGDLRPAQAELNNLARKATAAGFQVAVHAVEKEAIESAILAFEQAPRAAGFWRPRIEHCSECPAELGKRLAALGALVVSQPPFIYYSGERYLAEVDEERQSYLYPFGSLIRAGVLVAGSSDAPVTPFNPLTGIYAAVSRKAENGETLLSGEAITRQQALDMYTRNAAYASLEDAIKGTLAPGKLADMALLSDDPLNAPLEEVRDIKVEMTVLGGKVAWQMESG